MAPRKRTPARAMGTHEAAAVAALAEAPTLPRDEAAVALVLTYARQLDAGRCPECDRERAAVLADIGPKLLAALTALGMTAAGRGRAVVAEPAAAAPRSRTDELRERRRRRATGVDGASP